MGVSQKAFVLESGERYCLLVDAAGIPIYYPNLFVTTQIRNRSLSYSAMESTLNGLAVLDRFLEERQINIYVRLSNGRLFNDSELDAIRDYCQINFRMKFAQNQYSAVHELAGKRFRLEKVSVETEHVRLTVIAKYVKWLADQLVEADRVAALSIARMEKSLKARRPVRKGRNQSVESKGVSEEQLQLLFEIFRPNSDLNPFSDQSVRVRNRLIFLMLYHLGLRGGEVLNIKISDVDFNSNQLIVARRADEKIDPRKDQPLVKTLDRRLPLKDTLVKEIHGYIIGDRRKVANSSKNDYLIVTHKSGPTVGQPLSKSAYKKIIGVVRNASPLLFDLTGHQLRHAWNEAFSQQMDSMDEPPSVEHQEKVRSYLMGWREGSGTAATYNKRFIQRKAKEAAIALQHGMIRQPKGS